jgi:hypothetical protein
MLKEIVSSWIIHRVRLILGVLWLQWRSIVTVAFRTSIAAIFSNPFMYMKCLTRLGQIIHLLDSLATVERNNGRMIDSNDIISP